MFLMKRFYELLFYGTRESCFYLLESGNLENMAQQQSQILECIRNGDEEGAQEAMKRHIDFVRDFCRNREL